MHEQVHKCMSNDQVTGTTAGSATAVTCNRLTSSLPFCHVLGSGHERHRKSTSRHYYTWKQEDGLLQGSYVAVAVRINSSNSGSSSGSKQRQQYRLGYVANIFFLVGPAHSQSVFSNSELKIGTCVIIVFQTECFLKFFVSFFLCFFVNQEHLQQNTMLGLLTTMDGKK